MVAFFKKDEKKLISDSLRNLIENTNITQLTPGGKARFMIETCMREQASQYATFDLNMLQPYVQFADDKFLDFFGDMFNEERLQSSHAQSVNENFMFYVETGTFGDLNNGNSFTIFAGETVSTLPFQGTTITPGLESQPIITYTILEDVVCQADSSFVYASIRANQEGKVSSVPRNTLRKHSIDTFGTSLKCTNRFAIDNGDERESNDSYRFRLLQVFRSREKAIKASIRLAALSVSGVSDIKLVNYEQGPATYSLYIKSLTPTVSQELINTVSEQVNLVTAEGIRAFVLAPQIIGAEFVLAINWKSKISDAQKNREYAAMRNALESYMNNTEIGEITELEDIISSLLSVAPSALSVGKKVPNKFEKVYIYRSSSEGVGYNRSLMLSDFFEPLYNERVILETSGPYRGIQFVQGV
jgi:uncharacterized phage protein gp47/JayE